MVSSLSSRIIPRGEEIPFGAPWPVWTGAMPPNSSPIHRWSLECLSVPGRCYSLCGYPVPGVPPRPLWSGAERGVPTASPTFPSIAFSEVDL